jgi:hypothetical protein
MQPGAFQHGADQHGYEGQQDADYAEDVHIVLVPLLPLMRAAPTFYQLRAHHARSQAAP